MRELTAAEQTDIAKGEKRRRMAAQIRFRLAASRGAVEFIEDLREGLELATPRTRGRIEPELLAREAHLLVTARGLRPLVDFFKFAQRRLLGPILEVNDD